MVRRHGRSPAQDRAARTGEDGTTSRRRPAHCGDMDMTKKPSTSMVWRLLTALHIEDIREIAEAFKLPVDLQRSDLQHALEGQEDQRKLVACIMFVVTRRLSDEAEEKAEAAA